MEGEAAIKSGPKKRRLLVGAVPEMWMTGRMRNVLGYDKEIVKFLGSMRTAFCMHFAFCIN